MKRAVSFLIIVYASVPILLYLFPWILGHAIFAHLLRLPFFVDLSRPEDVLNHTCNFYLNTEEGISVGVWHTLPASQWEEASGKSPEWYRETLGEGHPVIIHLHGNVGTRAMNHRVQMVKILSAVGYHVLSLDYRGSAVDALILEAPYTRIGELVAIHPLIKMYMFLPGFESFLWNTMERNNIVFANDKNLKTVTSPLLILHAEDDNVVPYHMGLKLYEISLQTQKKYNTDAHIKMVSYNASLGFSHSNIYLDPNLSDVVREFLQNLRQ
ncbi:Monoacylglycerol lipase ABHD12 [Channa argus]|uniref:Monoacylglycerol lipase ABHD12 n=1 Tax=Channa argus TaxID=215402 RepID=A0A6G1QE28_CHAAH|nr:Monoacylglycerol lipase ABHD12 [Channa argus]